jgi:serine/threonine protein kinase
MDMPSHAAHPLAAADLSGRELGGYRLERRLGSGGMGDVYVAEQKSLGRRVAVKVLRPEMLRHPGAVERFEREARAAAALAHGNIVQIHEVACVDGIHFLAEEYVAGPSLKAWLASRGPLDARQALAVLAQVGAAVAQAAEQGIVHRDIKPENLLLTRSGHVKVADFGLARLVADDVELTQAGTTLGTPLYMSPEQGRGESVDARSDLYSLGATVYHLLAGRPPFSGPTAARVVMAHVSEPLVPLATLRPDLPPSVCAIVERLLAKDPAARFGAPRELVHEAEEAAATLPGGSRRDQPPLAWEGPEDAWAPSPPAAHPATSAATDPRVHEATRHLQAAIGRAAASRARSRRLWLATAAAATAAAAVGFVAGRWRARRGDGAAGRPTPRVRGR